MNEAITKNLWLSALAEIAALRQDSARLLFKRLSGQGQAFQLKNRHLVCVDEGITAGIHVAGSGILLSPEQRETIVREAKIEIFTTHDNCGAYALANPAAPDKNAACKAWGEQEAARLGLPHRHITVDQMDRPKQMHNAVAIYYDGTGRFNRIPGLPSGFVISRKYFVDATKDLELCVKIAFGEHGFGKRFELSAPLNIVVIADPSDSQLRLKTLFEEAETVAKKFEPMRILVQGLKMPLGRTSYQTENAAAETAA